MLVSLALSQTIKFSDTTTDTKVLENIAIITKDKEKLKEISNLIKSKVKVLTFDREDMIYNGGKVLLPAYYAKGLEFDGVILLDDFDNTPDLVKYIMCTRALHRLAVIK